MFISENTNKYGLFVDTLRTFIEKTYFGQISSKLDENGWYWKNEYDKNGRLLYQWYPFDFPHLTGINPVGQVECIPFEGMTTITRKRYDTIDIFEKNFHYGDTQISTNPFDLKAGWDKYPGLPLDLEELPDFQEQITIENEVVMAYVANNSDPIHSFQNISEAYLRLLLNIRSRNDCIILEVTTDQFGFEKRIMLDCPKLENLPNALTPTKAEGLPEFRIDLMPILNDLRLMQQDETLTFRFRVIANRGMVEFNYSSDDLEPSICIKGNGLNPRQDYTFRYIYNDSLRTTDVFRKIDDYHHTNRRDWKATWPNYYDGKYFKTKLYQGRQNLTQYVYSFIGHPDNPVRIDTVRTDYNGYGDNITYSEDQLGYSINATYDNQGRLVQTYNSCDQTTVNKFYYIDLPENLLDISGDNYQDFFGFCSAVISKNENGNINSAYYDVFGKLRRTIIDTLNTKLMTKYEYDRRGNLIFVVHPSGDTTKYFYDNFNRIKYKHNPDISYTSYSYDAMGRMRFSQNQIQSESNKVSFYEYDDLGRTTIVGEAIIDTSDMNIAEPQIIEDEYIFARLTDKLNPNVLNYDGFGTGSDAGILTANKTLLKKPSISVPQISTNFDTTSFNLPDSSYIDFGFNVVAPYIRHSVQQNYPYDTIASPDNFENLADYPQFILNAIWYDALPPATGVIWGHFPSSELWDSIAPRNPWDAQPKKVRNLKGKQSVVAYREHSGEPFHFVVFSYDPRGRVEAIMRYTENIGLDAVYYTYNSFDKVMKIKVVDPIRQYVTWYGYDYNGRVDSVWVRLDTVGSGFGINNPRYPQDPSRSDTAEIVYQYNRRGGLDETNFPHLELSQKFFYNPRGWLDSMIATRDFDIIFKQALERDYTGNVTTQISKQLGQDEITQTYSYDHLKRLSEWTDGNNSTQFEYDAMGNRLWTFNGSDTAHYSYYANNKNRLASVEMSVNYSEYSYNNIGAVEYIMKRNPLDTIYEHFEYSTQGKLKSYTKQNNVHTWNWKYRESGLGGREQKRLYISPTSDTLGYTHAWVYYLLGSGGSQHARWHGRQTRDSAGEQDKGQRVYMYPHSYLTNGGELTYYPDSTREYHISDALGSVRTVVKKSGEDIDIAGYDYKPFGDSLFFSDELPMQSFGNFEKDTESDYIMYGFRLYDPVIGRFLAPDPLLEAFPTQTPYQYTFNSPLKWRDPTGLAPEKEDKRDRVLYSVLIDLSNVANAAAQMTIRKENDHNLEAHWRRYGGAIRQAWKNLMKEEGYGGGGGGTRTGEGTDGSGNKAENGQARKENTGVQAIDGAAQVVIRKSVEDYYESLIDFNAKGYIEFTVSDDELKEIIKNDPNSNLTILYRLATNDEYTAVVEVLHYIKDKVDYRSNEGFFQTPISILWGVGVFFPTKPTALILLSSFENSKS